ncbi:LacI family DNA-binding transcriptional regulator [Micromonospora sp. PLK6-60]|uniref:LacI family DNA-binding transcriptional regulator n=1 Tax=Micromonospora sp. PLK6-60 TaxID=2873383 RepID=UPI001CA6180D|nr:LacI family DNA-binding transcriptional regulator [Micromonospora sp. PLK6-60]MBY8871678.1 LacI family DNA-binding transcriptional regulator [Micromonospora sp. PLK6-60]
MSPRRVTLADVARHADVSPTTASLVLSGRGREMRISQSVERRVVESAEELQYRRNIVSVGLRTGRTQTIGFVSDTVATSRLAGDMIKGALEAARERGVMLFIGETEGEADLEQGLLQAMHDRRVDGIILASMFTRAVEVPAALLTGPAVLLNAVPERAAALPAVLPDEVEAGRAAARILLDAGHREGIHAIGAGPGPRDVPPEALAGIERLTGIHEALAAAGVALASGRVCADWLPEYGYQATRELLERERPRALICLNDRLALGAYQALDDHALKVPTDVSVVSFDDHPIAAWTRPRLTTVALPHYDLGRKSVDVLFAEIERRHQGAEPDDRTYRVPMPVRMRESVAPPGDGRR